MANFPEPIENLLEQFIRLPGIGRRGAERLVTHLLNTDADQADRLAGALARLKTDIRPCTRCGNWAESELCRICDDPRRDAARICVVENPVDLYAFESSGAFDGVYHVLGGTLSPLRGITPDELNIDGLERRARTGDVTEVIIATSPTVEGDATAHYLAQILAQAGVEVARIGMGLPLGSSLGYADAGTLKLALEGRRKI